VGILTDEIVASYRQGSHALEPQIFDRIQGIVLVRVERVAPLTSPAYDGGATEAAVAGPWLSYWEALWARRRAEAGGGPPRSV